jgi:hypothetical protein
MGDWGAGMNADRAIIRRGDHGLEGLSAYDPINGGIATGGMVGRWPTGIEAPVEGDKLTHMPPESGGIYFSGKAQA